MGNAVRTAVAAIFALGILGFGGAAHALSFTEAAARPGVKIGDLTPLRPLFSKARLSRLTALGLSNVQADATSIIGDVTFMGRDWTFAAIHGGTLAKTFAAFGPKNNVKFRDIFGNARGVDLMDTIRMDDQMLIVAGAGVNMKSAELPARIRSFVGRFYEGNSYTLALSIGTALFTNFDMADSPHLAESMKFLGGKSTKVQLKGALAANILDRLVEKKRPLPSIQLEGSLPTFRPRIAGQLQLPADVQFTFKAKLTKTTSAVGFAGTTTFNVDKQKLNVVLENAVTMDEAKKKPIVGTSVTLAKGAPWKEAFGLKWLTIEGYRMAFKTDNGTLGVTYDGKTTFGSKSLRVGGSHNVTGGVVVPTSLVLSVDDGPNKVGAIALADMVAVYNEMEKAKGSPIRIPLDKVPDVALAGVKKGEGPRVYLRIKPTGAIGVGAASGVGFDMAGKLRLLGQDIATVERASITPASGVDIKTTVSNIALGPLVLPAATAEVVVKADTKAPRLTLAVDKMSLLGSQNDLAFGIYPTNISMISKNAFGDLLTFNLAALAGIKGINKFSDLKKADFRLRASLKSDPGQWITDRGKDAVNAVLNQLQPELNKAKQELARRKQAVSQLARQINAMRAKVKKERQPGINRLKAAEAEMAKLNREISALDGQIRHHRSRIKSCGQTKNVCYAWRTTGGHCTAKHGWWPHPCRSWAPIRTSCSKSKDIPDLPARAACEAANTKPRADLAWAVSKRGSLAAAKVTTVGTLAGLRKGITNLPVDLDPRVASLVSAFETARIALDAQILATQGVDQFAGLVRDGVNSLGAPNTFAIDKSQLLGSLNKGLQGVPMVLDLNYRSDGKKHQARMGFSLKDKKFNEKQLEVLALGFAVKAIVAKAANMKVVPHAVLDQVTALYLKRQAAVDEVLRKAIKVHGNITDQEGEYKLTYSNSMAADIGAQRKNATATRDKQIATRAANSRKNLRDKFKQLAKAAPPPSNKAKGTTVKGSDYIFGVQPNGDLKFYEFDRKKAWRQVNAKIGGGWTGQFGQKIFAGGPGELYGIQKDGALLYYRYDLKAAKWAVGGKKIGTGWHDFHYVFGAGNGEIYAIRKNGDLMAYKHNAKLKWDVGGKKIGTGWGGFRMVFAGGNGIIYVVDKTGVLKVYRHNQDYYWMVTGRRFGDGWQIAHHVFSTGGGRIYATKKDGNLYAFRHDVAYNWVETNKKIGGGWTGQFGPMIMGSYQTEPAQALPFNASHGWTKLPGKAIDVGAGPEGHLWAVGSDKAAYEFHKGKWVKRPGTPPLKRIDVAGLHEVWAIAEDFTIWRTRNSKWVKVSGLARDIGVGAGGHVFAVSRDRDPYIWNGKGWVRRPGSGQDTIDVDPQGNIWIVNEGGDIWRWLGTKWAKINGPKAKDIAIGPAGRVYIVGRDGKGYSWNGRGWTKNPPSGGQAAVSALPAGPVIVNTTGEIWRVK